MSALAACTVSALSGAGKTIRLIPAGLFRATDGRPMGLPGWTLNASLAATIIKAAASRADDFVIDYEHQTMQASNNGQPAPAAGWFKKLEWREGQGLFAVDVRWVARASSMIIAREYRYVSPVFGFDAKTGEVQSLHSAAITNNPALDGLTDIAAAKRQVRDVAPQSGMSQYERDHANRVLAHCFGDAAHIR